eukprot:CAMPEP_0117519554 /NCGR_PEP_ID=MMETSP0784-20121206/32710_1 /TAXON_ID=39447 /ORGANISM="" /LENGTH=235 /DNA_ID=CAMNT_0005315515 /DNA_START=215 /DNA_END=925 /DNA_ORIENTATION=-
MAKGVAIEPAVWTVDIAVKTNHAVPRNDTLELGAKPSGLDARKLRLASKNTPGVDGKSWLTDRHSPGRCDWAPLSARPVQMNPSSGWSSKALVDNGTNSGLPTIPGLLGEAKVRETLAQKLAQLRQETRETKHGCNAIAQHSVDVVRRPMTSTTPSERMCSIDADTDVPEGLFNELLKLGRQAKERGQHVLAPESSSPWTGSRRTARLLRHDHSSSFCQTDKRAMPGGLRCESLA